MPWQSASSTRRIPRKDAGRIPRQLAKCAVAMLVQTRSPVGTVGPCRGGGGRLDASEMFLVRGQRGFGEYSFGQAQTVDCHEVMFGVRHCHSQCPRKYPTCHNDGLRKRSIRVGVAALHAPMHFSACGICGTGTVVRRGVRPARPPKTRCGQPALSTSRGLVTARRCGNGVDDCTRGIAHAFLAAPGRAGLASRRSGRRLCSRRGWSSSNRWKAVDAACARLGSRERLAAASAPAG